MNVSLARLALHTRFACQGIQKEVFAFRQVAERDHNIISSSAGCPMLWENVKKC